MRRNAADYFSLFLRKPRPRAQPRSFTSLRMRALAAIAGIAITMVALDAVAIAMVPALPHWLFQAFDRVTDFGKSPWFLYPIGFMLLLLAMLASPALSSMSRGVLAAIAVRLGFLFVAIALPGLVFTIVKRLIGRARPLVGGSIDPFLYRPLGWNVEYASLPSGHAVDAFAAAAAIGALWPKTRPWMWSYAVVIAASRVVLTAHFPSDVLAGAIVAFAVVALVQAWFASRRLAFAFGEDGRIHPLPGPPFSRLKRVARALLAP
jgi:undecaprenyl-diphosphatase